MIEVKKLVKKYGNHTAVKNISFKIEKGKIYGFLGPNGAGKSTTMNIMTGCLAATDGNVVINGYDIYKSPKEAKKCIGYLPELPPLYTDMTPIEYLEFVGVAKGVKKSELGKQIKNIMTMTGITGVKDRLIKNLSKGFRQRVGLAQALIGNPEIIILDEPMVGLDPKQIIEMRELIKSLKKDHTVFLSSHILSEVSAICDYVLIISDGSIIASDTPENLSKRISGNVFDITAKGSKNTVLSILRRLNGIKRIEDPVENDDGTVKVRVHTTEDIRVAVFYAFCAERVPMIELVNNSMTLEDIFLSIISESKKSESKESEKDNTDKKDKSESNKKVDSLEEVDDEEDEEDEEYTPLFTSDTGNGKEEKKK